MNPTRLTAIACGLFVWCLTLSHAFALEEPPSPKTNVIVDVQIDGVEEALLGTQLTAVITLEYPSHVKVHFPKKPGLGKHIHMSGHEVTRKELKNKSVQEKHSLSFQVLRTGRQQFSAIEIPYVDGEHTDTVTSPAQTLYIKSRLANEVAPTLKPPSAPLVIHERNEPLVWALGVLGIILVTALITLLISRGLRSRFGFRQEKIPQRPAHEIANERLEALRNSDLLTQQGFQEYCFELTEITREYFTNRYAIHALGETTTELLEQLQEMKPEDLDLQVVSEVFQEADLIKFAKMPAETERLVVALAQVEKMVKATLLQPIEEEEEDLPEVLPAEPYFRAAGWVVDLAVAHLFLVLPALLFATYTGRLLTVWTAPALLSGYILLRDLLPGGSPGKRWLGMQVITSDDQRSNAIPQHLLVLRNVLQLLPVIGIVAAFVWIQQDVDACRPGDRLAGTMVINKKKNTNMIRPTLFLLGGVLVILGVLLLAPIALELSPMTAWMGD